VSELLATPQLFASLRGIAYDPTDLSAVAALEGASDMVRGYCGQHFGYVEDEEIILPGTGRTSLLLPELPVSEIAEIADHVPGEDDTVLETTDYVMHSGESGIVRRLGGSVWPRDAYVKVTYTHGYHLPGGSQAETLPADLQMVVCGIAGRFTSIVGAAAGPLESESIGSYSVTYGDGGAATEARPWIIPLERSVLDRYRRVRII
jgi:hypothetical protein